MNKKRIEEIIVVEGKYDAAKLADLVDALIIPTGGFSVFSKTEIKDLILQLGKKRGIIVLTDSDAAGFRIRTYLNQIATGLCVKNAYIPAIEGKERRKEKPSKEGLLGVEGVSAAVILQALERAGASARANRAGRCVTYTDLYCWGLSGTPDSSEKRRDLLQKIGLPARLSKKALCEVINSLYTYEEFSELIFYKKT